MFSFLIVSQCFDLIRIFSSLYEKITTLTKKIKTYEKPSLTVENFLLHTTFNLGYWVHIFLE